MEVKILCTQWGYEHLPVEEFFASVRQAGYDGVDTWLPENRPERQRFIRLLKEYDLAIVSHQHQAAGSSIREYCRSYEYYLEMCMECKPIRINSHSGRDYFTLDEQLQVIDVAEKFSLDNAVVVAHETHRGRIGFSPGNFADLLKHRPGIKITADFSHWVCVTESHLENFSGILDAAIGQTAHTHARVGFTQGPQVPDPASPVWKKETALFLAIWRRIFERQKSSGEKIFTITPEFGPPPYMWTDAAGRPVSSQWDTNIFIRDLLTQQFKT